MAVTVPLDQMSVEEKIQLMESIWEDLSRSSPDFPSPSWHKNTLDEREEAVNRGDDNFVDWEKAKQDIKNSTS